MAAEQRSRCGSATDSCALTRVHSGNTNLHTKTKDGGVSKEQNGTRIDGELSSSSCCHRFYVLLYAPPSSTICFLGNQSPSTATSTYTFNPLQSKARKIFLELIHLLKERDVCKYERQMSLMHNDKSKITVCVILQVFLLLTLLQYNCGQHY